MTTTKPYHPLYNAMSKEWNEQDLAYFGKKPWTNYCINRHPLESKDEKTSSDACTRFTSRKIYATNPVLVRPPIQKVQNSAQKSGKDADVKTSSEYINDILTTNADGEGLNWYTWLTSEPLAALARNGLVYIGVDLPEAGKDNVTEQDYINGSVPPPKFFHLRANQVVNWIETEGDIKKGQFSALMYKSTITKRNSSGFNDVVKVLVHYTDTQIFTYNLDTGAEEIDVQENSFKFVPFVRAEITLSLIGEAVQYSKAAVELNSLSFQNMRDGYFNILQARGFQIQDSEGKAIPLSADKIVNTPAPEKYLEFIAPETAPEGETREQIKALQEQADISVQQVHSSFAQSIGSGVALKEQGSDAASSVKYMMDILLDKFAVAIHMAMKVVGHPGEVVLIHPENYTFSSEAENIENAEDYRGLAETSPSKEAKKAYTFKANAKIFDGEVLEKVNKADADAIDNEADDIPIL
jgi:hypothetical protein